MGAEEDLTDDEYQTYMAVVRDERTKAELRKCGCEICCAVLDYLGDTPQPEKVI